MTPSAYPPPMKRSRFQGARRACTALLVSVLAGCALTPEVPLRPDTIYVITGRNELIRFNAGRPDYLDEVLQVKGLQPDETVLGMDFRPANRRLYVAGSSGRLYTLDTKTGAATQVGGGLIAGALTALEAGFDFNPVADRIRMVDSAGSNIRVHPDTVEMIDGNAMIPGMQPDGKLAYSAEDTNAGRISRVAAVAYTRGAGAKTTTNYAIEAAQATLVTIGRPEGTTPAKTPSNPNEGQLFTVGRLGVMTGIRVSFDIHPQRNSAYASFLENDRSVLYEINLASGTAKRIGDIGLGLVVRGLAIAP